VPRGSFWKRLLTRQVRQKLIDGDEVGSRSTAEMKMLRAGLAKSRVVWAKRTPGERKTISDPKAADCGGANLQRRVNFGRRLTASGKWS